MDVLEAIKNRHCFRAFIQKPVAVSLVKSILEVARFAPSGANTQPWHVVVVTGSFITKINDSILKARAAHMPENPDYHYYPTTWVEPYKSRRIACGRALYSAVDIKREEIEKRNNQWNLNYCFFGAPVGLLFFLDAQLEKGSWIDMGMFAQNVMLAARDFGLETCPQASMAEYPDIIRDIVGVPKEMALMCGMAMGYPDSHHPINQYRTERESVESFTQFFGF